MIISLTPQENLVLAAREAGQSVAAIARRYRTTAGRIAALQRSARGKLALAMRLRRMRFPVIEVIDDQ
jgi:transcriptional regulator